MLAAMLGWQKGSSSPSYRLLKNDQDPEEHGLSDLSSDPDIQSVEKPQRSWIKKVFRGAASVAVVLVVVGFCIYESIRARDGLPRLAPSPPNDTSSAVSAKPTASSSQLSTCPKRREWRTLSASEQRSYISAVQCLLTIPSTLNLPTANTSAYSDFPYIHAHIGYRTHNSAPFLPWHRYLLHIYETTLRTQCNYSGTLVYWDWTLDSSSLSASPVFDPVTGFGGDGDPDGPITVGKTGRCVVDGPFAGIQALWYDVKYQRHCLSRGFRDDWGNLGFIDGTDVSPESIELAMELDRYEDFVRMMEVKVHDAIPFGIGGDFETFSAPFDPLFYLHHVQLDRIWWTWQQRDPENRLYAYDGHNGRHSIDRAKLTDTIHMGGLLAPDVQVAQVMDTSGGCEEGSSDRILCYTY